SEFRFVKFAVLVLVGLLEQHLCGRHQFVEGHLPLLVLVGALHDVAGHEVPRAKKYLAPRPKPSRTTRGTATRGTSQSTTRRAAGRTTGATAGTARGTTRPTGRPTRTTGEALRFREDAVDPFSDFLLVQEAFLVLVTLREEHFHARDKLGLAELPVL